MMKGGNDMMTTVKVNMDEELKVKFESICKSLSIDPESALRLFAIRSVEDEQVFIDVCDK